MLKTRACFLSFSRGLNEHPFTLESSHYGIENSLVFSDYFSIFIKNFLSILLVYTFFNSHIKYLIIYILLNNNREEWNLVIIGFEFKENECSDEKIER